MESESKGVSARCFMRRRSRRLVCEVTAVGKYAGRPLKAGDAAQPRGCSARFVPAVFGPFGRSRTRNELVWIESLNSSLKRGVFKDNGCKMMGLSLKRMVFKDECQSGSGPVCVC